MVRAYHHENNHGNLMQLTSSMRSMCLMQLMNFLHNLTIFATGKIEVEVEMFWKVLDEYIDRYPLRCHGCATIVAQGPLLLVE
jgi:hypothetical protein